MSDLLRTGKIELFVNSRTLSTVRRLVIDNRFGPASRIGTWEARTPMGRVYSISRNFGKEKLAVTG